MKSKLFEFEMVLYPFPLLVSKDFDWKEIEDNFYVVTGQNTCEEFNESLKPIATRCAHTAEVVDKESGKMYYIILLYEVDMITTGTLAHEAGHVSTFLGHRLGFEDRNWKNDEPYAYVDQFVADCIDSVLKDKPKEMKGKLYTIKKVDGSKDK